MSVHLSVYLSAYLSLSLSLFLSFNLSHVFHGCLFYNLKSVKHFIYTKPQICLRSAVNLLSAVVGGTIGGVVLVGVIGILIWYKRSHDQGKTVFEDVIPEFGQAPYQKEIAYSKSHMYNA